MYRVCPEAVQSLTNNNSCYLSVYLVIPNDYGSNHTIEFAIAAGYVSNLGFHLAVSAGGGGEGGEGGGGSMRLVTDR